jgi:hypothetical protein
MHGRNANSANESTDFFALSRVSAAGTNSNIFTVGASGELIVNGTGKFNANNAVFQVMSQGTNVPAINAVVPNGAGTNGIGVVSQSVTAAGTGWFTFVGQSGNGTTVTGTTFQVFGNGNVQNTNNSYGAISDARLKENVTDATPKLDELNQVRVVNYNLISDAQKVKQLGVIAQELALIFPGMVEETTPPDIDGVEQAPELSVKYSVFVPILIKAVQELSTKVDELTTRVTELESK